MAYSTEQLEAEIRRRDVDVAINLCPYCGGAVHHPDHGEGCAAARVQRDGVDAFEGTATDLLQWRSMVEPSAYYHRRRTDLIP